MNNGILEPPNTPRLGFVNEPGFTPQQIGGLLAAVDALKEVVEEILPVALNLDDFTP